MLQNREKGTGRVDFCGKPGLANRFRRHNLIPYLKQLTGMAWCTYPYSKASFLEGGAMAECVSYGMQRDVKVGIDLKLTQNTQHVVALCSR